MMFIYMNKLFLRTLVLILILELNWDVNSLSALSNLPLKSDLIVYLKSIERIMEFCATHNNDIDLNLEFGLFLLDVNVRHFMTKKKIRLPLVLKTNFQRILKANEPLFEFFRGMVNNITDVHLHKYKIITSLFKNVNAWVKSTKDYSTVLAERGNSPVEHLIRTYSSWDVYIEQALDMDHSRPSPRESDGCMSSLSNNPIKKQRVSYKCANSKQCNDIIANGTSYGYALTHRVLYLLAARAGRNCHVFSPKVDDALIDELCSSVYEEAQYIALNGYKHADLIMEQMCLCSLAGHASFLQRHWLTSLLRLQTSYGCFRQDFQQSVSVESMETESWRILPEKTQLILGKRCNGHVTAVAAATLGAAIRYIVETYY